MATHKTATTGGDDTPPSVWRNRNFLLLWGGQAVSALGSNISTLALPLLALALTHSPAQAGFIAAAQMLPYVALSLPAGAAIDRWDRKAMMLWCNAVRGLAYVSLPLAFALGHLAPAHLYAVALVAGTGDVLFDLAQVAALPRVVPEGQVTAAYAATTAATSGASLLGPGLGGLLIGLARTTLAGAALAYLIDGLSYLASAGALACVRVPFQDSRAGGTTRSLRREIGEGLHFLWRHRRLRAVELLTLGTNLFLGATDLALIVLAREALHAGTATIGLLFSVGGAGALLGALAASRLAARRRVGRLVLGAALGEAIGVLAMALAPSPAILAIGVCLAFAMASIYSVTAMSYRLSLTPDALQGRVNSVGNLLTTSCIPLSRGVGGALLGPLGPRAELWAIAIGLGGIVLVARWSPLWGD